MAISSSKTLWSRGGCVDWNCRCRYLAAHPPRLAVVFSRGNPLWFGQTSLGGYFGSLWGQLPSEVRAVPDDHAGLIDFSDGSIEQRAVSIGE